MVALAWLEPLTESTGDEAKRLKAAAQAASDVLKNRDALDGDAVETIDRYLTALRDDLRHRLLADPGSLTDFSRRNIQALLADVDRLVAQATRQIAHAGGDLMDDAADLGAAHAASPLDAAGLQITTALPGLDQGLVQATYNNMVQLLTEPMQQFADRVKLGIRRVANAGDSTFGEIANLRDDIEGAGFDAAQFRAERIVRTEVGRIFNESSQTRLLALSRDFPFIRKCWRATRDSRTRKGHTEAAQTYGRGSGIPIADHFHVNVYDERGKRGARLIGVARLRFPIDPDTTPAGRVAAGATIMCRCNAFIDFEVTDFRAYSRSRIQNILGPHRPSAPAPAEFTPPTPTTVNVPDDAHPNIGGLLPGAGTRVPMS